jgi:hypothetical protein
MGRRSELWLEVVAWGCDFWIFAWILISFIGRPTREWCGEVVDRTVEACCGQNTFDTRSWSSFRFVLLLIKSPR